MDQTLTEGKLFGTLIRFTIPFLLSTLLQTLYGTVDLFIISKFCLSSDVSAVSTGSQVLNTCTFLMLGLTSGATVLLGQFYGAKDEKKVAEVIGDAIIIFTGLSVIATIILVLTCGGFLDLLQIPPEARTSAITYTTICCLGIPLIMGYNVVCSILRSLGDSKSPLLFIFIACIINIIGDTVLTGFLGMGSAGVAIATVTAQGISFIIGLFYLKKHGIGVPFHKSYIRFSKKLTIMILKIGIPSAIKSVMVNFSFLLITAIINHMGVLYSAAMGVGDKIVNIAFLPQNALYCSICVIVAQNIGAGKPDRAKKATIYGIIICVIWGLVFFAISNLSPEMIPSLFTKDPEVCARCALYVKAYSIDCVLTGFTFCLASMFMGCGKSGFVMAQDLISTFAVRVPVSYVMSRMAGVTLYQIGLAAPAASLLAILMLLLYLKFGKWKTGVIAGTLA